MEKRARVPKTANTTRLFMNGWYPIRKTNEYYTKSIQIIVLNEAATKRYVKRNGASNGMGRNTFGG